MKRALAPRRDTEAAGRSWRKWEHVRIRTRPWWRAPEGAVGFWLICGSLGAWLALVIR